LTPKFVNSATANGAVNKKKRRWKSDSCTPLPSRRPEKHSPWFTSSCLSNYLRTVSTKVHEYPRSFGCVITSASFVTGDYPFNRTPPALRGGTCRTTVIPKFVHNATKKWVWNKKGPWENMPSTPSFLHNIDKRPSRCSPNSSTHHQNL
jgi:hypothetical protein